MIDEKDPQPQVQMARLAEQGVRGFRITPRDLPVESWLQSDGVRRMFAAGTEMNLAICPLIGPTALTELNRMCDEFPDTTVIIDHLSRIGADGTILPDQIDRLCAMAQHPNVRVKVSAFYALGEKKPPHDDLTPLIRRVYDAFGPDRLMWASDCPYQVQNETYENSISLVRDRLEFLTESDKAHILGKTAESIFFSER